ncbi:MAG: hypothetical protein V7672_13150 [Brevundimonas sp.]|uniref:hypothetical protein n=1 Tax=Brevundimonas sp. TaxID=1871086 RepID=UPI003001F21E
MNVDELYRLGVWFSTQFQELKKRYAALQAPLSHNASQPDKRPVESELDSLVDFLRSQHFDELSLEQLKMLGLLGVDAYIGPEGAAFVEGAVRTSNYDPATAVTRLNEAIASINEARAKLAAYVDAVDGLALTPDEVLADEGLITIRVGFQNDVAIDNVADWKNSAKDWYDIIRGLAMACNEKPEDVKVIGASTGSIIMIMAGTAAFTAILAQIAKHMTTTAKDVIGVRVEIENLRQKKLLTRAMEEELRRIEKDKSDNAIDTVIGLLKGNLSGKDGDVPVALSASIKKLLTFSEKGGTVDFVAPELDEGEDGSGDADDDELKVALIAAKAAIREYQGERESLKLLSSGPKSSSELSNLD